MPTELLITDTSWASDPNTSAGGAGTTTGAGHGWIDVAGSQWNVASGRLTAANTNNLFRNWLLRPSSEDVADQRVVTTYTFASGGANHYTLLRANRSTYDTYAVAYVSGNQRLVIYKYNGTAQTAATLAQGAATGIALTSGVQYRLDAKIVGNTITATLYKVSDGSVIQTLSYTDSSSPITGAGAFGITHQFFPSIDRIVTYNEDAPATTGYTAAGPSGGVVNAVSTLFTVGLSPAGSIPATDPTTITPSDGGGGGTFSPTTITLGTSAGQQATFTYTPHSSGVKTIAFTNNGGFSNPASIAYTASAAALVIGTISTTALTSTSVSLSATAATGGTGALTYQWYRSTTAGFTPGAGNIISGATSLTLVDTGRTPDTLYFYKLVVTDSLAVTSTTAQYPVQTRIDGYAIALGALGDSYEAYKPTTTAADGGTTTMPDMVGQGIRDYSGNRPVTVVNQAVAGKTSTDWAVGGSLYTAAKAAFIAAGVTDVIVLLGANDSRNITATSAVTYLSNISGIVADLVAAGMRVWLNGPVYTVPGSFAGVFDEASVALVQQYRTQLLTLINGNTVRRGDWDAFAYYARVPTQTADGVHPLLPLAARHAWFIVMAMVEGLGLQRPSRVGPAYFGARV